MSREQGIPSAVCNRKDKPGPFRHTSKSCTASPVPNHARSALLVQITRARTQTKQPLINTRSQNLQTSLHTTSRACCCLPGPTARSTRPGNPGAPSNTALQTTQFIRSFFYHTSSAGSSLWFAFVETARGVRISLLVPQGKRAGEVGRVWLLISNGTLEGDRT